MSRRKIDSVLKWLFTLYTAKWTVYFLWTASMSRPFWKCDKEKHCCGFVWENVVKCEANLLKRIDHFAREPAASKVVE